MTLAQNVTRRILVLIAGTATCVTSPTLTTNNTCFSRFENKYLGRDPYLVVRVFQVRVIKGPRQYHL